MQMRLLIAAAFALTAWAQTRPNATGAANGADFSAAVAPGSLASVFGTNLAGTTGSPAALPFPATFQNVTVNVNGRPAPITYLSPTQINFQVPATTAAGMAAVTVANGAETSAPVQVRVEAAAPGIFQYGANRGIVQNQDYALNTTTAPAAAGSAVIVYLTGIGATTPAVADGNAAPGAPLATPGGTASATIGGRDAQVLFLGLTPGNVGLAQANLLVPDLPTGDHPIVITVNGRASRPAMMAVRGSAPSGEGGDLPPLPSGAACVSGNVDYVVFSLATKASRMADEISIGGKRLCPTCELKPPVYGNFAEKIEAARIEGLRVDACYDSRGTLDYVRMRP